MSIKDSFKTMDAVIDNFESSLAQFHKKQSDDSRRRVLAEIEVMQNFWESLTDDEWEEAFLALTAKEFIDLYNNQRDFAFGLPRFEVIKRVIAKNYWFDYKVQEYLDNQQ